ncbi:MAG: 30S ribosomal protein S9 [Planctomycetota bacterium]
MSDDIYYLGTGRRKTSVARVRLKAGSGKIVVNDRECDSYFPIERWRQTVRQPLKATKTVARFDVLVNVVGGGPTGQADAVKLGIARALRKVDRSFEPILRDGGLLTRDSRMVERKKYGQKGARRSFQFSKR